jgi:Ca2+-binding RTX toxin-like protein
MVTFPILPADILAADAAQRAEFQNYIDSILDAAQSTSALSPNNDLYIGNINAQTLNGQSGNDAIAGLGGDDIINAGDGDDYVLGGDGADTVSGAAGNDFLFGEAGNDILNGGDGDDAMFGGIGNDRLTGAEGNDWLYGNAGADVLDGGNGNDIMDGGASNDRLTGGNGNDQLIGGAGIDTMNGGADNDFMFGGAGADRLTGGTGDDVFHYARRTEGVDNISDFGSGDSFSFVGLGFGVDPGTNLNDGSTFISGLTPVANTFDATVLYNTNTGGLWFDMDGMGAGAAVQIATLTGAPDLTAQDFIFV